MSIPPLTRTVTVRNPQGLHARPADMLVRAANKFESKIWIGKADQWVDCKSILSLLTLGAVQGTELTLSAQGADAEDALQSVVHLFEAGFDEMNEVKGAESATDS